MYVFFLSQLVGGGGEENGARAKGGVWEVGIWETPEQIQGIREVGWRKFLGRAVQG